MRVQLCTLTSGKVYGRLVLQRLFAHRQAFGRLISIFVGRKAMEFKMRNWQTKTAAFLIMCLICAGMVCISGCTGGDYPVTVGNVKFDKEPQNIVVLSDNMADIISCIGYDVKMVGKSDSVTQKELNVVPSVGSEISPDVNKIIEYGAEVVFCDEDLNEAVKDTLEQNGIKVIKMVSAETTEELSTVYKSVGKILGGENTGAKKGGDAYDGLIAEMEEIKYKYYSGSILNTVCYVYSENNKLVIAGKDSFADILLSYTGAVNVAVDSESAVVDENNLKISNPTYIFYSDETALNMMKNSVLLQNLGAIKAGNIKEISYTDMSRHGLTALVNLQTMVDFMYKEKDAQQAQQNVQTAVESSELTQKYSITIPDEGFKQEDEGDGVKAMQTRLLDLGYISDAENASGYYGETTQKAVSEFQKNNGIEETGTADKATLDKMFTDSAVKATAAVDSEE